MFTNRTCMKKFNIGLNSVINVDTDPPYIIMWMFTNKPCIKEFQHYCRQCDQCRYRTSLNSNVNVHKQTMHWGSCRYWWSITIFDIFTTRRPGALKFVTQGGGDILTLTLVTLTIHTKWQTQHTSQLFLAALSTSLHSHVGLSICQ